MFVYVHEWILSKFVGSDGIWVHSLYLRVSKKNEKIEVKKHILTDAVAIHT